MAVRGLSRPALLGGCAGIVSFGARRNHRAVKQRGLLQESRNCLRKKQPESSCDSGSGVTSKNTVSLRHCGCQSARIYNPNAGTGGDCHQRSQPAQEASWERYSYSYSTTGGLGRPLRNGRCIARLPQERCQVQRVDPRAHDSQIVGFAIGTRAPRSTSQGCGF